MKTNLRTTFASPSRISRRDALLGVAALFGGGLAARAAAADPPGGLSPAKPFSFDGLIDAARRCAAAPFEPPQALTPEVLEKIDYDAHWRIRFRDEATVTPAGPDAPVQFFHPGRYFREPVKINLVEGGVVREALFSRDDFDIPPDSPALDLSPDSGFVGLRVMRPGLEPDWASFLGASYFRTDGPDAQYGLSARGVAVDTGLATPEEFPRFTEFWIGAAENDLDDLTVWALLDGPSVAGAYRFGLRRGGNGEGHRTEVAARLFMRKAVERLGIAPLTSMYWYSERDARDADDWRPEIHDSDGLAIETGVGERIWRPLENPTRVKTVSFLDRSPRGFGLIQRDRAFESYQDDGVFYNRRPSAWIEPLDGWGPGAVQLVLIPTADETFDNVVAYWAPETVPAPGEALSYDYAIHWVERDPTPVVASVVATRQGGGGAPGQPIPPRTGKMVIDFEGEALSGLSQESGVEPVVEARGGRVIAPVAARPVVGTDRWRLTFDFTSDDEEPVQLRAYLRRADQALTETWVAEATPPPAKEK